MSTTGKMTVSLDCPWGAAGIFSELIIKVPKDGIINLGRTADFLNFCLSMPRAVEDLECEEDDLFENAMDNLCSVSNAPTDRLLSGLEDYTEKVCFLERQKLLRQLCDSGALIFFESGVKENV